jgi:rubrerythrin
MGGSDMKLQTASSVISFSKRLEEESARFYEALAGRFSEGKDSFLGFAQENRKYTKQVEMAYYGVISDAIEGCFAFDLEEGDYALDTKLSEGAGYADALSQAVKMEEVMVRFYDVAAEQSKSLMADVPRAFMLISRKRGERLAKLKSL